MACLSDTKSVSLQGVHLGHLYMQVSGVLFQDSGTQGYSLYDGVTVNLLAYFFSGLGVCPGLPENQWFSELHFSQLWDS